MRRRILISAGEASGDRLGAGLARALKRLDPELELVGMGGTAMAEAGVRLVQDSSEVSVVGISEVLARLPQIRRAMARLQDALRETAPDLCVPIDFPDFNLRLARHAGRLGVPVVYLVSPQVWAWRPGRVRRIRGRIRRMLVLFEFETAFYEREGIPVDFVGHPLAEPASVPPLETLRAVTGLAPGGPLVALLPGSRRAEIGRHFPILLDAAGRLQRGHAGCRFLVPLAPGVRPDPLAAAARAAAVRDVHFHAGDFPELLRLCDAGAVASGTATLEAAVTGLPLVVIYRLNPLTHWIAKRMIRVEHVALPNLIAGRRVVPELLQQACTGEAIAREVSRYLADRDYRDRVRDDLAAVRRKLGPPGVFERAATRILSELAAR